VSAPDRQRSADDTQATLARRSAAAGMLLAALLSGASAVQVFAARLRIAVAPERAVLRLNPNRAAPSELALLPGIGPRLAERIVAHRRSAPAPAFRTAEDLQAVPGIGPVTIARLRVMLRFDPLDEAARAD
jgi:competence protein ComEA